MKLHFEPIPLYTDFKKKEFDEETFIALGKIHDVLTDHDILPNENICFTFNKIDYKVFFKNIKLYICEIKSDKKYSLFIPDIESYRFMNRVDTIEFGDEEFGATTFNLINTFLWDNIKRYYYANTVLTIEDIFNLIVESYNLTCNHYNDI